MRRAVLAAGVLLLAGCGNGSATTAADQVPALGSALTKVDTLMAAHHWNKARAELRRIISEADAARDDGDLDEIAADRVVASAQRLLAALPTPVATPSATPTPSTSAPKVTQSTTQKAPKPAGKGKKRKGKKH